jgi:hypothetical protein
MSLDNFQLPLLIIPELYKDSLVLLDDSQQKADSVQQTEVPFLGKFQQKILILIDVENQRFLSEPNLQFLTGILNACKLTLSDIAVVNINHLSIKSFQHISSFLNPEKIIIFGIALPILEMPLEFPQYQLQKYAGRQFLAAPQLSELELQVEEKKKLWNALKLMFNL